MKKVINTKFFTLLVFMLGFAVISSLAFAYEIGSSERRDNSAKEDLEADENGRNAVPVSDPAQNRPTAEEDRPVVDRVDEAEAFQETVRERAEVIRELMLERQAQMRTRMEAEREGLLREAELRRERVEQSREAIRMLPLDAEEDSEALRERREAVQNLVSERRRMVTEEVERYRLEAEERRQQAIEDAQERRARLLERIQQEQDERIREVAQRVAERLGAARDRVVENYILNLGRMEIVLTNIATAADRGEAREVDVESARQAIEAAEGRINEAKAFLNALMEESYVPDFEEGDSLGVILQAMRDEMRNDLQAARELMQAARQSVVDAASTLAQDLAENNN